MLVMCGIGIFTVRAMVSIYEDSRMSCSRTIFSCASTEFKIVFRMRSFTVVLYDSRISWGAEMIRLRETKRPFIVVIGGGNSLITAPLQSKILLNKCVFWWGYTTSIPHPKTAIVFPPLSNAQEWAMLSIPKAIPEIMV